MTYYDLRIAFTKLNKRLLAKSVTNMHITSLDQTEQDLLFTDVLYYNRKLSVDENRKVKLDAARLIGYKGPVVCSSLKRKFLYVAEEWQKDKLIMQYLPNGLKKSQGDMQIKSELAFPLVKDVCTVKRVKLPMMLESFRVKHFLTMLYNSNERFFVNNILAVVWKSEVKLSLYLRARFNDYKTLTTFLTKQYIKEHKLENVLEEVVEFKTVEEYSKCLQ